MGLIVASLLLSASTGSWVAATAPPGELAIWIGPGPFVFESGCLAQRDDVERPTPLPFPRQVLEDEMRQALLKLGVPLVDSESTQHSTEPIRFGACVWKQKDGRFWYALTLSGPWPQDQLGDVEDVSVWPHVMETAAPDQLRSTLLRETRQLAREFVRLVRVGRPPEATNSNPKR